MYIVLHRCSSDYKPLVWKLTGNFSTVPLFLDGTKVLQQKPCTVKLFAMLIVKKNAKALNKPQFTIVKSVNLAMSL